MKVAFGVLVPCLALASTVESLSLEQRAAASDRVVIVQVITQRTEPSHGMVKTLTQVAIGTELKGHGPTEITIVQVGGRSGPLDVRVSGDAHFAVGETALVFLKCARPDRCYLVGLADGRLPLRGNEVLVENSWRPVQTLLPRLRGAR